MKKGRFRYIVLIVILAIYAGVMYVSFGVTETKEREASATLIVGNTAAFDYMSRNWTYYSTPSMFSKLNWKTFKTYVDDEYFGNYLMWYDDQWYLFDKDRNPINYSGKLFAYDADYDMNIIPFESEDITDFTYPKQVLEQYGLDSNSQYTLATVSTLDFDKDGEEEEFYVISNVFAMDFFPDTYFSFVFMVDDNKISILYEDVDKNDGVNGCKPELYTVGDFDNDSDNELIVSCAKYSNQTPVAMLYEYEDNAFKIVISN